MMCGKTEVGGKVGRAHFCCLFSVTGVLLPLQLRLRVMELISVTLETVHTKAVSSQCVCMMHSGGSVNIATAPLCVLIADTHTLTPTAPKIYSDTHTHLCTHSGVTQKDNSCPVIQKSQGRLSYYLSWLFVFVCGLACDALGP